MINYACLILFVLITWDRVYLYSHNILIDTPTVLNPQEFYHDSHSTKDSLTQYRQQKVYINLSSNLLIYLLIKLNN